ncbi:hypothetical protein VTK73DRAFT_8606 [Phialemonium thermophilum]|uniref:VWFA domain-containing protein n=1 Tax=Phialemonium thermophilum TaxID=223376 RepID=A0ABR3XNP0_9PEZI
MSLLSDRRSLFGSTLGSVRQKMSRKPSTRRTPVTTSLRTNPFHGNPTPRRRLPRCDAPPSYVEATSGSAVPHQVCAPSIHSVTTAEDPYAFLSTFDTVFLVDDSGSMAGRSWHETEAALRAITPICTSHDADGVDVYFLNARNRGPGANAAGGFCGLTSAAAVENLFSRVFPSSVTPTGTRIQAILGPYLTAFERAVEAADGDVDAASAAVKPVNLIVITDGVPTDDPESVLLNLARRLDRLNAPPYQVGVQFFQVGNEPGAREALIELDDNLGREAGAGVRDMVDTTTWDGTGNAYALTGDGILKAVLGAVVKRLDRRRISLDGEGRSRHAVP